MYPVVAFAAVVTCSFGSPNCTRLNMLKISPRNSRVKRSLIDVLFAREKSKLLMPGPRSTGSVALSSPSVYGAGTVKHETLNQSSSLEVAEPLVLRLQPGTTLGRRL